MASLTASSPYMDEGLPYPNPDRDLGCALDQLADQISKCRRCDRKGVRVQHAPAMNRGTGTAALIIGIEPGTTELTTGEAFSGVAGKRLLDWLQEAGLGQDRPEILKNCHLTSLLKCQPNSRRDFRSALNHCLSYLELQIQLLDPRVYVTLGKPPLEVLLDFRGNLTEVVGHVYRARELGKPSLFPIIPADRSVVPLPHPSPASPWLHADGNAERLGAALAALRTLCQ